MHGFIGNARREFASYRGLAEKAMERVDDTGFFASPGPESNSIAVIVKHMAGNLRSRWTDFLTTDGEKPDRDRDSEFTLEPGDTRDAPDFNIFFRDYATYPFYSDAVWYLTQMRRWGQIPDSKPDDWYAQVAQSVYRPDLYLAAARDLVDAGQAAEADFPWSTDGYRPPTTEFIDKVAYDGRKPNAYLQSLKIGLKSGETVAGGKVVKA